MEKKKTTTFCMKKKKKTSYTVHSIKLPHSVKTPSLAESKYCRRFPSVFNYYLSNETKVYFTVLCLVTWALNGSKAGGDLVLAQTSLLLLCKSSCNIMLTRCINMTKAERSPPASLSFKGWVTEHTTVKWRIHVLVLNAACVAVLFAYKWLHNFVKEPDEI